MSHVWSIRRRLKAKKLRQRVEAEIYALEQQADREQNALGQPTPATLKKIHNRKLKLNQR